MGSQLDVNRFSFRQSDSRRVKGLDILVSNDNSTWTKPGQFYLIEYYRSAGYYIILSKKIPLFQIKHDFFLGWDAIRCIDRKK
jgi:hypothetical protein